MPRPLPDPLRFGPFRRPEAVAAGITWRRLRAADVAHPHQGLYAPAVGGADDVRARCERAMPLLGERRMFSHLTAARLHEMPLPFEETPSEPLHVLTLPGAEPIRRPGIVGWETEDRATSGRLLGLLAVAGPADVWCQLAVPGSTGMHADTGMKRSLSPEWLVAVGDFALTGPRRQGGRHPLCTIDDLALALRRHRGKRGAKALQWALDRVRAPVHSPRESRLRLALVARGLPEPDVQMPVMTAAGLRHADLGYPQARLAIEYQGDQHRTSRAQWLEDLNRRQLFEDAGYSVIAVGANEFDDECAALAIRVRRALARAGYRF
ncbi:hypothetical protein [Microbacterium sp.]|uniref:hypothetical protein n=1 Tax=Microbacterium sp. TaxID=51671 RepID=UPI0039E48111